MSLAQSWGRLRVALHAALLGADSHHRGAGRVPRPASTTDRPYAATILRELLAEIGRSGAAEQVQFEVACQPRLEIRIDPERFQAVVAAMVRHAATQAPAGRVLVTCAHKAGRLRVAVVDDGFGGDASVQESELRSVAEQLALQGGSLELTSRDGEGTTVLAYWPDVRDARTEPTRGEAAAAPKASTDKQPARSLINHSG